MPSPISWRKRIDDDDDDDKKEFYVPKSYRDDGEKEILSKMLSVGFAYGKVRVNKGWLYVMVHQIHLHLYPQLEELYLH